MMTTKRMFLLFVLLVILERRTSGHTDRARQKRMLNTNAFDNDINKCLFNGWTAYVGKINPHPGLRDRVKCKGKGLCYGADGNGIAQYAACYNQKTLIPEFTGHIVHPGIAEGGGREDEFVADTSIDPVATDRDYRAGQMGLNINYDSSKQQFFARGHLTPNADFNAQNRAYTMITTNIAPQWQRFNAGNWNNLEKAIRQYATNTGQALYVFTGTGGEAKNIGGVIIKLNGRVLAPKWYWKAVCDPVGKQSVFFWGENTITDTADSTKRKQGCFDLLQPKRVGIIYCSSVEDAKKAFNGIFQIPDFHEKNCAPDTKGEGFRDVLTRNLETVQK